MKRIIRFLFVFTLLLSVNQLQAQWRLIMEMVVTDEGRKLAGAEIKVFKNGSLVETVLTDAKGRADLPLDPGGDYMIEIAGNNGFIKKKLSVNTKNVPAEAAKGDNYFPAEVDVFQKVEGLDYAILDKPIGKILYDPDLGGFDVDVAYTKQQKAALDKLQKDFIAQKAKEAAQSKEKQKEYDAAVKIADKAFAEEKWELAEENYKKAAVLMPSELHPQFQLAELKTKLIKIRETNKKYDEAITKADAAAAAGDLEIAISQYGKASGYKPDEAYPKDKLKEYQSQLANQAKVEQDYLAAIEKGDNALKINDLGLAKTAFEEASSLKSNESYPKNKLAEINDILAKEGAKEAEYNTAIKAADDALAGKDYEKAKANYKKALGVKPTESYPQDQITKVDGFLAEAAKKEQNYLAAIEKGDNALAANNYEEAKSAFTEASDIKPLEEYPKNKIKEIDQFIANNASKDKEYNGFVAEADKLLQNEKYEEAKAKYAEASTVKPKEAYPKEQIKAIDGKLKDLAAEAEEIRLQKEKEAALEAKYQELIVAADALLVSKEYEKSKIKYNEAIAVKDDQYPKDKISEIEQALTELAKEREAAEKLETEYQAAIKKGDEAIASKDYSSAQTAFKEAFNLKKDETYPKEKLIEIEGLLADIAKAEENYVAAIANGDKAFKSEDWEAAKTAYNEALAIKQDDYPKNKLAEIESKIVALAAEKEAAAKLEADYQSAISEGDKFLADKKYDKALESFNQALALKPDEKYPDEKVNEIKAEQEKAAKALAEEERLAALQKQYEELISKADTDLSAQKLNEAKTSYQEALSLKSDEEYPKTKISEIDKLLAEAAELDQTYSSAITAADQLLKDEKLEESKVKYTEASSLKPTENYPKDQLSVIDTKLAEIAKKAEEIRIQQENEAKLEAQYQEIIAEADKLLENSKYTEAKQKYTAALAIKEDNYPKEKITEIEGLIASLADKEAAEKAAAEQAKIDANYLSLITEADALLADGSYDKAKSKYSEANTIKNEQYLKDKIAEIEGLIALLANKEAAEKAAAEQAKIDANYQSLITEADALLAEENYDKAKNKYTEAIAIKNEEYPKEKITEIDGIIASLAGKEAAEKAAAEQAKLEARYLLVIADADAFLVENKLDEAKLKYEEALAIKEDSYPTEKIEEIEKRLLAMANKEEEAAEKARLETEYLLAIENGDNFVTSNKLEEALSAFKKAQQLKPQEEYPANKISEINSLIANQALQAAANQAKLEEEYNSLIVLGDEALSGEHYSEAKQHYQNALNIKSNESYPQEKLNEIKNIIAKQLAEKSEIKLQQEREAKNQLAYQSAVAAADKFFVDEKWNEAENEYGLALSLKPSETYPQEQLAKIDDLKAKKSAQAEAAKLKAAASKERDAQFMALMESAQQALEKSSYNLAKKDYSAALQLKPSDSYAQSQLRKVEGILAKQKQQELAKKEEISDEPIQIKKGPKSSINGDAEAEIERLYKEMWAKKNSDKNELLKQKEEAVRKYQDAEREAELQSRQNALERIEAISISVREQLQVSGELNLQNYETVKQKEETIKETEEELRRNAERKRNDEYANKADLEEDIKNYQGKRDREMLAGKKEMIENEEEEIRIVTKKWEGEQRDRIQEAQEEFIMKEQEIKMFNKELATASLERNTSSLDRRIEEFETSNRQLVEGSSERIATEYQKINDKEQEIRQFNQSRSDHFKDNQLAIEEKEKILVEETKSLDEKSEERRQQNTKVEFYDGDDLPRQDPEAANYNQGVTEEIIENDNNSTTIRRIVVNGTEVDIYEKTFFAYGAVFYTKNGNNITEDTWDAESK